MPGKKPGENTSLVIYPITRPYAAPITMQGTNKPLGTNNDNKSIINLPQLA